MYFDVLAAGTATPVLTPASSVKDVHHTALPIEEAKDDTNVRMPCFNVVELLDWEIALQLDPDSADKSDFDWWSKYYYSIGDERRTQKQYVKGNYDKMVIYEGELEDKFNR